MRRERIAKHLYRLANGGYQTDMHEHDGVKRRRTHPNKKAAEVHIARMLTGRYELKVSGRRKPPAQYLMLDAINDFEMSKVRLNRRPSTIKRYKPIFEQLRIFVRQRGIEYVAEFTSDHGTTLFDLLTEPRIDPRGTTARIARAEPRTINQFLRTIKGLFIQEIRKGHIQTNPLSHVEPLPVEKKRPEYYTHDELHRFFSVDMHTAYRRAFMGLFLTGMRFSELANLRFVDIDMQNNRIHVQPYQGFKTKTANAERKIPMGQDLRTLIEEILTDPISDFYVFSSLQGRQFREQPLLVVCKRIGEQAGLTCRMFLHKFRHTFATFLVRDGVPLEDIKELLGHSSIKETEIYAHHRPDDLHHQVRKLDGLLS